MFENCPPEILTNLFEFLNFSDLISIKQVNKLFYSYLNENESFYSKEILFRFFPSKIDFYCYFGDSIELKTFLLKKNEFIIKNSNVNIWKKILKNQSNLHNEWVDLLNSFLLKEEAIHFSKNLFETFREPPLPFLKLKRENVGAYSKTWFQNKLCDILYLGSQTKSIFSFPNEDLNFFTTYQDNFFEEEHEDLELLKDYRWYNIEEDLEDDYELYFELKPKKTFVIKFLEILYKSLKLWISTISHYLELQNNPLDLILHYIIKWNTFVASIPEIENIFSSFVDFFNKYYEHKLKDYPTFPKFSIWRLMRKIWIKIIYQKYKEKLMNSFSLIVNLFREKTLNNFCVINQNVLKKDILKEVEEIFIFLNKDHIKMNSEIYLEDEDSNFEFDYVKLNHEVFDINLDYLNNMITSFMQTLVDLSINEINVHYLGHSKIELDSGFEEINDLFIKNSIDTYKYISTIFETDPLLFLEYMTNDYNSVFESLNEKTAFSLQKEQTSLWLFFYKKSLFSNFHNHYKFPNEIKQVKKTENLEIDHYYKLLSETIFEMPIYDSECPKLFQNYNNSEELLADQLFQQISISIISLKDFEKIYETYISQLKKLEKINEKPEIDLELDELNEDRDLKLYLTQNEKLFYNCFEKVTKPILEDLYKNWLSNVQTHENDEFSDEDADDYSQSNVSLETYNEEDEELKLSKKNSEIYEEISLKKGLSNKSKSKFIDFRENRENFEKEEKDIFFVNMEEEKKNNNEINKNQIDEEEEDIDLPLLSLK